MQRKPWTPDELAALRHLYPDWSAAVVAAYTVVYLHGIYLHW